MAARFRPRPEARMPPARRARPRRSRPPRRAAARLAPPARREAGQASLAGSPPDDDGIRIVWAPRTPGSRLEVVLEIGLDIGRRHRRFVTLDDLAVPADQELGEIPLDLVGAVCAWPDLRDDLVEAAVLRPEVTGSLGAQPLVQRVGVRAVDLDLGEHREGHVVG